MGFLEDKAVVLRSMAYGETDRIVSFLTREHGRLRAMAKGARSSRRRFGWNLEPLSLVHLRAWEAASRGLLRLDGCELVKPFGTSGDLAGFAAGCYAMDLVESLTGEGEPCAGVFDLMAGFLDAIGEGRLHPVHLRVLELRLAVEAGYAPRLDSCIGCSCPATGLDKTLFQPERGGILCARCAREGRESGYVLSRETLAVLTGLLGASGRDLWGIDLPAASARECARMLPGFLVRLAGREIRSLKFLREVWPEGIAD